MKKTKKRRRRAGRPTADASVSSVRMVACARCGCETCDCGCGSARESVALRGHWALDFRALAHRGDAVRAAWLQRNRAASAL